MVLAILWPEIALACGGDMPEPPPNEVNGVVLRSVFDIPFEDVTILDIYDQIYYSKYEANQIVCRSTYVYEEGELVPLVMWAVWYRPGILVSQDAECVDSKKFPKTVDSWVKQDYRWLGSGNEPHPSLVWLWGWKENHTLPDSTFEWCRAKSFSYAYFSEDGEGEMVWGDITPNSVFKFKLVDASALVSRDVVCTSNQKIYSRWLQTPGWNIVNIK